MRSNFCSGSSVELTPFILFLRRPSFLTRPTIAPLCEAGADGGRIACHHAVSLMHPVLHMRGSPLLLHSILAPRRERHAGRCSRGVREAAPDSTVVCAWDQGLALLRRMC